MKTTHPLTRSALQWTVFGFSAAVTVLIVSLVYAATTYYSDLPTVSSGSGLTATSWNDLVNYANKAVKQDTEVLTVTGGRVGIGTTSPAMGLHLLWVESAMNYGMRIINSAADGYSSIQLGGSGDAGIYRNGSTQTGYGGANSLNLITSGAHPISFSTSNTERMRILSSGNVGIGTPTPGQKLSVAGTIESTSGGYKFPDGTVQTTAATLYKTSGTDYCGGKAIIGCSADDCGYPTWGGSSWTINTGVYYNNTPSWGVWRGWFTATYVICTL